MYIFVVISESEATPKGQKMRLGNDFQDKAYLPAPKKRWDDSLKKLGKADVLRTLIDKDLDKLGLRRGMVYYITYKASTSSHPYPTITLNLADKSGDPYLFYRVKYNQVGTRIEFLSGKEEPLAEVGTKKGTSKWADPLAALGENE